MKINKKILISSFLLLSMGTITADYLLKQAVRKDIADSFNVDNLYPIEITQNQFNFIVSNIGNKDNWTKCYDSKTDGYNIALFHQKCDSFNNTVSIITDKDSGKTVAGYSGGNSWGVEDCYTSSSAPRLFRLEEGNNSVHSPHYTQYSMCRKSTYGPTFGGGHDIYIGSTSAYCNGGHSYTGFSRSYCHNNSNNSYSKLPNWVVYSVQ